MLHDTDLYDLKVRANGRTAVIDTTSNHLFWVPGADGSSGRWTRPEPSSMAPTCAPHPAAAIAAGGYTPHTAIGWMWDLTVPGNNDHDLYVIPGQPVGNDDTYHVVGTSTAAVLVHNCQSGFEAKSNRIAKKTGYTARQIDDAIHAVKNQRAWRGIGVSRNPDVTIHPPAGEVYPQLPDSGPADDSIGNIFDHLPDE